MIPLLALSVLALGTILDRGWFWIQTLNKERQWVGRILTAVREDWPSARSAAKKARDQPIGRFLLAAMRLDDPDPEVFKLALEAAADEELVAMRKGDKVLEATIALSPLLGLLGTVLGLIHSLSSIRLADLGTDATSGVTLGIGEALISTATGLIIAITTLAFYRLFQGLAFNQAKLFRRTGNDLELLYRQLYSKGFRPSDLSKREEKGEETEAGRGEGDRPRRGRANLADRPKRLRRDLDDDGDEDEDESEKRDRDRDDDDRDDDF